MGGNHFPGNGDDLGGGGGGQSGAGVGWGWTSRGLPRAARAMGESSAGVGVGARPAREWGREQRGSGGLSTACGWMRDRRVGGGGGESGAGVGWGRAERVAGAVW